MADLPDGTPERYSCANCGGESGMYGHWNGRTQTWSCTKPEPTPSELLDSWRVDPIGPNS